MTRMADEAAAVIRARFGALPRMVVQTGSGIVLGEGAGEMLRYADIPHFPRPTVKGHLGEMRVIRGGAQAFAHLSGRAHYYEGIPAWMLGLPLWALSRCGVYEFVSISACGALNEEIPVGGCVLIHDFINFAGVNSLRGITSEDGTMRFPPMRDIADPALAAAAEAAASRAGMHMQRGVYAMMPGPAYETLAEIEMLRRLGGNVVGMSTVPELMAARALEMRTLAIAAVTNHPFASAPMHTDVVANAAAMQPLLVRWLDDFLACKESC
jgi:purine-nucleoside phosphorylase